jgi:hypothetical protein
VTVPSFSHPVAIAVISAEAFQIVAWSALERFDESGWGCHESGLQAQFPPEIESHSAVQEFYFDEDHLLRRHDYRVEVAGGFPAVQYVYDIVEVDGIKLPSKRRAYRADAQGNAIPDQLMVAIDLSDISFD